MAAGLTEAQAQTLPGGVKPCKISFRKEWFWDDASSTFKDFLLDSKGTLAEWIRIDGESNEPKFDATKDLWTAGPSQLSQIAWNTKLCVKARDWAWSLASCKGNKGIHQLDIGVAYDGWRQFYTSNFISEVAETTEARQDHTTGYLRPFQGQEGCQKFLSYSSSHLFAFDGRSWEEGEAPVVDQVCNSLWLSADTLPVFKDISTSERDSWCHLLLSNLLETFSDATAKHLAKLGFDYEHATPTPSSDSTSQANLNTPNVITLPFFILQDDEYTHEPCNCTVSWTCHASRHAAGTVCAAALDVFDRLSVISLPDGEEKPQLPRAPLPPVVFMGYCGEHVRLWVAFRTEDEKNPYRINCIWKGDMTQLRDVVRLKAICTKISEWAVTEFRTTVSNYIASWKNRFLSIELEEDDQEMQGVESLVTKIGNLRISRTNSLALESHRRDA